MFNRKKENKKLPASGIDLSRGAEFHSRNISSGWWYSVMQAAIALMGLFGITYTFISLFHLPMNHFWLIVSVIIDTVLFTFIYKWKNIWKWAVPCLTVFWVLAAWLFRLELVYGYKIIVNRVVAGINRRSALNLPSFYTGNIRDYSYYVTVFIILALFLLSMAVVAFVVRKPNFPFLFLVTFPFAELGLFFGIVPSYFAFFLLLACWIAVCAMQISSADGGHAEKKQKQWFRKLSAGTGITMAVITLLISGGGYLLFSPEDYNRSSFMDNVRSDIQSFFTNSSDKNEDGQEITVSGGMGEGRLGVADKIVYKREKALEVSLPANAGCMYLKGYVGSIYTGNSWEVLPETDYQSHPVLFENQEKLARLYTMDSEYRKLTDQRLGTAAERTYWPVTIQNVNANSKYAYIPYKSTFSTGDFHFYYDSYASNSADTYRFQVDSTVQEDSYENEIFPLDQTIAEEYVGEIDPEQLEAFFNLEEQYRTFVHEAYTYVPEVGNERLIAEMQEFYRARSGMPLDSLIEEIRDYLADCAVYSLEAGRLPKGKDFVDYFLYENHKGSCSHFASAAVLMFRCGGIPARYVEGYVITQEDIRKGSAIGQKSEMFIEHGVQSERDVEIKKAEILDTNAHAWVEIYLNGYGWTPVEVTPGFSNESINLPDEKKETSSGTRMTTIKQSANTRTTLHNSTAANSRTTESATPSTTSAISDIEATVPFQAGKLLKLLLMLILLLLCAAIVILLRHTWANFIRKQHLHLDKPNECISYLYSEILKLLDYCGVCNEKKLPPKDFSEYLDRSHHDILPEPFAPVMELILQAEYSVNGCTREEAEAVLRFVQAFTQKNYESLSWMRRLSYRYIENLYWR